MLSESLLKSLKSEYPEITEEEWINRYYLIYKDLRDTIEQNAIKNNNVVSRKIMLLYQLTPRHIQVTFNGKYRCEQA